jgi:hypothetical protein
MSNLHFPIINNISEVESWPFIASYYNEIIYGLKGYLSKYFVIKSFGPFYKVILDPY